MQCGIQARILHAQLLHLLVYLELLFGDLGCLPRSVVHLTLKAYSVVLDLRHAAVNRPVHVVQAVLQS